MKILTDPLRLKQILLNLISNAIKFTDKGYIELKVDYNPLLEIDLDPTKKIRFSIIDSGRGIPEEKQKDLFGTSFKENSKDNMMGAGFGLSIVSNLCDRLDSSIEYSNNIQDRGSIFYFNLKENIPLDLKADTNVISCEPSKIVEALELDIENTLYELPIIPVQNDIITA